MNAINPDDPHLDVIRAILNRDKIKLWLSPYTNQETKEANIPPDFLEKICGEIRMEPNQVLLRIEYLRQNALERLDAQSVFKESGIATVRAKIGGKSLANNNANLSCNVSIALHESGRLLKTKILDGFDLISSKSSCSFSTPEFSTVRLISRGKVLNDDEEIQKQGIRNGSVIMVLLGAGIEASSASEDRLRDLEKAKKAAEILSSSADFDVEYSARNLTITDQNGKPVNFQMEEKKNLVKGMALHEKAKKLLKLRDYDSSLPLLIEADLCFSRCTGDILGRVDNVALCQLDIVWCYLSLSNVSDLPDADERLKRCEECFVKSYGADLTRAANLKGEVATTQVLIGRLHLLQGILAFHKGDLREATRLITLAEKELNALIVSPEKINQVMLMGFSEQEARLGLRACNNEESQAVDWIMRRRGERKRNEELVMKERRDKKRKERFGKTIGGKDVNLSMFDQMMEMGFAETLVLAALKQTDNNMVQALNMIETEPELLVEASQGEMQSRGGSAPNAAITDQMVAQLTSLGFDSNRVIAVLNQVHGDVERAVQVLLENADVASSSSSSSVQSFSSLEESKEGVEAEKRKRMKLTSEEMTAFEDLVTDLEFTEDKIDEHLDLTLDEEISFLAKYKSLL